MMSWLSRSVQIAICWCLVASTGFAQSNLGFDNRKPSGQPYLSPEESLKRLQVPPGFEVKLFAAEPDIINPIAFTVDERGRLWVVECYEYPKRTPPGQKPRDRIKILEDTTGAGRADKVTVWAEGKDLPVGFDLATGIEVGNGGVYLGAAPHLFFLRDSKGSGHCDEQKVLLSGFGSQDTHETLNTLQWGPDSALYGLHGIFTRSRVDEVRLNAAVWRFHPTSKKFDVFAEGTSNPWGLDFDQRGQAFLTACVIPHAFHIVPGGIYIRQAGSSFNPYAYGYLHEISDHLHHQESGWAHAGALVLQGDDIPEAYRGSLLMGSIHGCSVKRDVLRPTGSTFVASHAPDFLVSEDKNFRPINLRWGPDGSIYVIDWHDQNPCHQAAPDSWDMTHGRIYKIQVKGRSATPPPDLSRLSSRKLVETLKNNSPWWHRTALRLLAERRDQSTVPVLKEMTLGRSSETHRLRALWALYAVGGFDEAVATELLHDTSPCMRLWTIRFLAEGGSISPVVLRLLTELARSEKAAQVRSQLASAAQRLDGRNATPLLHNLMEHLEDAADANIPLLIWLAYEPQVIPRRDLVLAWLREHCRGNPLVTNEIVPRVVRRLVASEQRADLSACLTFVSDMTDTTARRSALDGLVRAWQSRQHEAPPDWRRIYQLLRADPDPEIQSLILRLGVGFGDPEAIRQAGVLAANVEAPVLQRADAIHDLALAHAGPALDLLLELAAHDPKIEVRQDACRALSSFNEPSVPRRLLAGWQGYPDALRTEVINVLAGRQDWARELLNAVEQRKVKGGELTNNTILKIRAFHDSQLDKQIEAVWGKVRGTSAELDKIISNIRNSLSEGDCSFERGRKLFDNHCAKCHRFEGRGHDVGPALDGAARDIEYLLVNVLDPNRVVGQPYYTRVVALKDGRVESGLMAGEDSKSMTLKTENGILKVFAKKDVETTTEHAKSLMPEGLDKNMTVQDFRDLVRYVMVNPFITNVSVAGPVPADAPAPPAKVDPSNYGELIWLRLAVGPAGKILLPDTEAAGAKKTLVSAKIFAPGELTTRLQIGAVHPVQIWVNGKEVYSGQPSKRLSEPDQAGVDVRLRKGMNSIVFQVTYQGKKETIYARLLDPIRQLRYEEVGH